MMMDKNVLGTELQPCCMNPLTGYFRDGLCRTMAQDTGTHVVCAIMTSSFLNFTKLQGNDLVTPRPEWQFPGLKPGDKWCLCISRWLEAEANNCAPEIVLEATHEKALEFTSIELLRHYEAQAKQ
jgi:uncharacterized protein (DUF2237 family)